MKPTLIYLPLLTLTAALLVPAVARGAEPVKLDVTVSLDAHGDGTLEVKTHLDAMSWRRWEILYGNHPDLILRNLRRQFAGYDLDKDSYRLDKDEVKRVATARLQCHALAALQKDGSLAVALPKPMRLVTHSGHEWIFTQNTPESETTTHVLLPEGESDARLQYADSLDQQLLFHPPALAMARPTWLVLAGSFGGLGVLLLVASCFSPNRKGPGQATVVDPGVLRSRSSTPAPSPERN